jgi:nucleoside-diphosphate-sugar epimerase
VNGTQQYWKDATCLITGGVGFLGSHLCKRLASMGARTTVLDIEDPHPGTLFSHNGLNERALVVNQDCAAETCIDVIRRIAPDYIFHLAALPYAPYTTAHPAKAEAANVTSTETVLEAARELRGTRLVFSSSACVFGATRQSPLAVNSPYSEPAHYYTVTKRRAEEILLKYRGRYGIDAVVCRFGNIYGPGDRHFGRIVPQICWQLIVEDCDQIRLRRSRGVSVFEFLYIDDAVDGLLSAAREKATSRPIWHFTGGPKSRIDILGLAVLMSLLYDGRRREVLPYHGIPEQAVVKYLDASATSETLGFDPAEDLYSGLSQTLKWYRSHIGELKAHPSV